MRSCGTPCKCLDFGPFSGVGKSGQKSRFFLWIFDEKRTIGLRNFEKKIFIFARRFWPLSRGCTSRFLECTKMIGIIWESVLRVPILLLLSDGFFGGPARGPEKKVNQKVAFLKPKNLLIFFCRKNGQKTRQKWPQKWPPKWPPKWPSERPRGTPSLLPCPVVFCNKSIVMMVFKNSLTLEIVITVRF